MTFEPDPMPAPITTRDKTVNGDLSSALLHLIGELGLRVIILPPYSNVIAQAAGTIGILQVERNHAEEHGWAEMDEPFTCFDPGVLAVVHTAIEFTLKTLGELLNENSADWVQIPVGTDSAEESIRKLQANLEQYKKHLEQIGIFND